jgi:hypothetical protein
MNNKRFLGTLNVTSCTKDFGLDTIRDDRHSANKTVFNLSAGAIGERADS